MPKTNSQPPPDRSATPVVARESGSVGTGGGAKHDAGKIRAGLVVQDFPRALLAVGEVATFGAQKYAAHSWRHVPDAAARYYDAFIRHQLAAAAGEQIDRESGLPHAAHVAWNALALLELELAGNNPVCHGEKPTHE